ncbi:hypothetical protein FIBSPDRAFT_828896 [Athelia psychrophila]|uniref:F-box domain-containing protein n=1 Tax=Athelia psychrophila TaxID=1759441 RepID=A0A166HGF7_9AGAM|nr:hypothetical protein FIBSPDRAFT_828896 [Fibularhizoctonia sp. CBS 109695]
MVLCLLEGQSSHRSSMSAGKTLTSFCLLLQTCTTLRDFTTTRSVFRKFAHALLCRCRPLPLPGFQRIADLSTDQLMRSVNKATRFEDAWRRRAPRPMRTEPDGAWCKVVSSPENEEIDWLSPITSSYMLCATKSGKVVCWDVASDSSIAEWNPGQKWELWKCRVEFDERAVYFTMAKLLSDPKQLDDDRVMDFILMRLSFPEAGVQSPPSFSSISSFKTTGVVMNVFLLDPGRRILAMFVWVSGPNTIGLYTLLDWDTTSYVYVDTGIECLPTSNWSCILHNDEIVIHSEELDAAHQHFYPIDLLQQHERVLSPQFPVPAISARISPARTQTRKFIYPPLAQTTNDSESSPFIDQDGSTTAQLGSDTSRPTSSSSASSTPSAQHSLANATPSTSTGTISAPGPFASPPWYPESAHFVRQWWPTLPGGVPKVSCTVILLADHDPITHHTRFAFAQHYFTVPFDLPEANTNGEDTHASGTDVTYDPHMMTMWYVNTTHEVVYVQDSIDDEAGEAHEQDRSRPLVAVDFGHAVWVEYCQAGVDRSSDLAPENVVPEPKCLKFVTFPPTTDDGPTGSHSRERTTPSTDAVKTLEVPDELDLDTIETINIDQSQGAVILSSTDGKIFFLFFA